MCKNVDNLGTEENFCDIKDEVVIQIDAHSRRRDNALLQEYVVEETTGNSEMNKDEMRRLFYSTLNQVISKIDARFSYQNTRLYAAVFALQPENINFLDVEVLSQLSIG